LGPILYNEEVHLPSDESLPDPYNDRDGVFVTVGSDHHPFDRLMEWCGSLDPIMDGRPGFIQHGPSWLPKGWDGASFITYPEMLQHIRNARVVVSHGGPATVAICLALGKRPIVLPRLSQLGEVVDDHQVAFAERLALSGHALVVTRREELERVVKEELQSEDKSIPDLAVFRAAESVAAFEELVGELLAKSRK
jgi:UDP-N-acetylglucosamine transferase subunit ALG13